MLLDAIYWIVIWILVPAVLVVVFIGSIAIAFSAEEKANRTSGVAGLFAGIILSVIYIVSVASKVNVHNTVNTDPLAFNLVATLIGFGVGFLLLWLVRLIPERLIGLISLSLSASSTSALYSYFFSSSIRGVVLYLAISAILGILIHLVFFPRSIE